MNWEKEKDFWEEYLKKVKNKRYFCNISVNGEIQSFDDIDHWKAKEMALRILNSEKGSVLHMEVKE